MANYRINKLQVGGNAYEFAEWYGVCSTAAGTQAKTVTISGFTSAQLVNGCKVTVYFNYGQDYNGTPHLNVSNTGQKLILRSGGYPASQYEWKAYDIIAFVYKDNCWIIEDGDHADTTYYGKTKLSNTIADDQTTALTPKAVYDAGFLTLADLPVWDGSVT